MDKKSLMELYERMIQGQSSTCALIDPRKILILKKQFSPSELAKMRFSDHYLELIDNQAAFNQTVEALKNFYVSDNHIKSSHVFGLPKFYQFLFEHLFSQSEKVMLEKMVSTEFSGNKSFSQSFSSQKIHDAAKDKKTQNENLTFSQDSIDKHVFFELLESMIWDQETLNESNRVKKKPRIKEKFQQDTTEMSLGKMMSMLM